MVAYGLHSNPNPNMSYGIYSNGFNNIEIKNCIISNFTTAINLRNSDYSRITDNSLHDNTNQGIWLRNVYGVMVSRNTIDRNGFRYFLDWGNLTFPLPIEFSGIYVDYMLEPKNEQRPTNSNTISNNNLSDNSQNGIVLDEGLKYNIVEYNTIFGSGENIGNGIKVYSNANQINNNDASYGYYAGISLTTSSYNKVYSNIAYHNNYTGILLEDSSNYNDVYYNNIIYNGCEGIYINRGAGGEDTGSTHNRIFNNDINNNTLDNEIAGGGCLIHFGVLVDISPYNYIYYNNITDNGVGISPDSSHHQYYFNNTINITRSASMGIFFQVYSKESIVSFNKIYGPSCINISYSHDNISIEDNELNCNVGISITGFGPYENITVSRNHIAGNKGFLILASYNSREFNIKDNVIDNIIPIDIYALNNDVYGFVNDSYNKSVPEISTAGCSFPVASRDWYFRVYVRDMNGTPIANASVKIVSLRGDVYEYLSDNNGSIPMLTLPEYQRVMNWSQDCLTYNILMNSFSPYTINVSKQGYRVVTSVLDLNRSQEITVTLQELKRLYAVTAD